MIPFRVQSLVHNEQSCPVDPADMSESGDVDAKKTLQNDLVASVKHRCFEFDGGGNSGGQPYAEQTIASQITAKHFHYQVEHCVVLDMFGSDKQDLTSARGSSKAFVVLHDDLEADKGESEHDTMSA